MKLILVLMIIALDVFSTFLLWRNYSLDLFISLDKEGPWLATIALQLATLLVCALICISCGKEEQEACGEEMCIAIVSQGIVDCIDCID